MTELTRDQQIAKAVEYMAGRFDTELKGVSNDAERCANAVRALHNHRKLDAELAASVNSTLGSVREQLADMYKRLGDKLFAGG